MKKYFTNSVYRKALTLTSLVILALCILIAGFIFKPFAALISLLVIIYGGLLVFLSIFLFGAFVQFFRKKEQEKMRKRN